MDEIGIPNGNVRYDHSAML